MSRSAWTKCFGGIGKRNDRAGIIPHVRKDRVKTPETSARITIAALPTIPSWPQPTQADMGPGPERRSRPTARSREA
jgi:hypothetical protein